MEKQEMKKAITNEANLYNLYKVQLHGKDDLIQIWMEDKETEELFSSSFVSKTKDYWSKANLNYILTIMRSGKLLTAEELYNRETVQNPGKVFLSGPTYSEARMYLGQLGYSEEETRKLENSK